MTSFVSLGDGDNNVTRSLAYAVAMLGGSFAVASPHGYELDEKSLEVAREYARRSGAKDVKVTATDDAIEAVRDATVVYTDTYVSMGDEEAKAKRLAAFGDAYRVTEQLMQHAKPGARFMHDMPAYRGIEVDADVMDGPRAINKEQAHNRMHAIKAIMLWAMHLESEFDQF